MNTILVGAVVAVSIGLVVRWAIRKVNQSKVNMVALGLQRETGCASKVAVSVASVLLQEVTRLRSEGRDTVYNVEELSLMAVQACRDSLYR